jgi:lysophospholipase L1-like esterase
VIVACLGDSITEGSPYRHPEGGWEYWAALRHPGLEFRNHGIWGERTDQIAERLETAVDGAEVLIVQGGINDLAQGRPLDEAAHNLEQMVHRGLALGLRVAICDVLPWNNGWPTHEAPIRELNERIRRLGVPVLPFHDTLEDPGLPGRMKAEWCNEDGDHPSLAGYRRLGETAFRLP